MFSSKKRKLEAEAERAQVKGELTAMKAALTHANEKVVEVIDRLKQRVQTNPRLKIVRSK